MESTLGVAPHNTLKEAGTGFSFHKDTLKPSSLMT